MTSCVSSVISLDFCTKSFEKVHLTCEISTKASNKNCSNVSNIRSSINTNNVSVSNVFSGGSGSCFSEGQDDFHS